MGAASNEHCSSNQARINSVAGKDYKAHGIDSFIEACRKTNTMIAEEKQPTTWKDLTVCIDDLLNVVRQLATEAEESAERVDSLWLRIRTLENSNTLQDMINRAVRDYMHSTEQSNRLESLTDEPKAQVAP